MTRRLRVAVLFGGTSTEHEVSVVSARGVIAALDPSRYEVVPVGIAKDGTFVLPSRSPAELTTPSGTLPAIEPGDGAQALLRRSGAGALLETDGATAGPIDVVFPVLHGSGGEDGSIQGFLETLGVAYVGSGIAASALGMGKHLQKPVFAAAGVPVTPWLRVDRVEVEGDLDEVVARALAMFALPVFVKPSAQGSSVGVHKAKTPGELAKAFEDAVTYDGIALVEEAIAGREIECALLGNEDPQASVCGEIVPCREFYDFEAKYLVDGSELHVPADLPAAIAERVRGYATTAFRALGCAGMARVDFFVAGDRIVCNELNTIPGFTPISMYPKLWEASGVPYGMLIDRLIALALDRHARR